MTEEELTEIEDRVIHVVAGLDSPAEAMAVLANVITHIALTLTNGNDTAVRDLYLGLASHHGGNDGPVH